MDENLLKQIKGIASKKGLELTDALIKAIINESYFVRDFGMPKAERAPEVIIEDIIKSPTEFCDLIVKYSSQSGSLKNHIRGNIEHLLVQEWFQRAGDLDYEEYHGKETLEDLDKICEILEDVDDVPYEIQLNAEIAEYGCVSASRECKVENAEKELVNKIVQRRGIYDGVLFIMLKEGFEVALDEDFGYDDEFYKNSLKGTYKKIFDMIGEYEDNNTINGIKHFLEGLDSGGLSPRHIDYIKRHDFEKNFGDMVHSEEQTDIVPGHPNITLGDIQRALGERDKGITMEL